MSVSSFVAVPLELPVFVVKWAAVLLFEPPRNAVEVERVVASAPGGSALISCVCDLVGLAVDAGLHDVIFADGAVVNSDV